jgi:hypothetical protein
VNGWEWQAGPCSGITDTPERARERAAAALRSRQADEAEFRQVIVVTGIASLKADYVPVNGTHMQGRRCGRGVWWRPVKLPV